MDEKRSAWNASPAAAANEVADEHVELALKFANGFALCLAERIKGPVDVPEMHLGQEAYEAYARHTGFKSLATGQDLPQWEQLSEPIRAAWTVSAAWVAGRVMRKFGVQS